MKRQIQQLGFGWWATRYESNHLAVELGLTQALAYHHGRKVLGWFVTGDHGLHIRYLASITFDPNAENPTTIQALDDDEIRYAFTKSLTEEQEACRVGFLAEVRKSRLQTGWDKFPPRKLTLQNAAKQMGYAIAPPPWETGQSAVSLSAKAKGRC